MEPGANIEIDVQRQVGIVPVKTTFTSEVDRDVVLDGRNEELPPETAVDVNFSKDLPRAAESYPFRKGCSLLAGDVGSPSLAIES